MSERMRGGVMVRSGVAAVGLPWLLGLLCAALPLRSVAQAITTDTPPE
ncbi:MAG: hypothetical protein R3E65_06725 [Steroidobacteraceae bacterium]